MVNELVAERLKYELVCQSLYRPTHKDILIVVHNQPDYVYKCLSSVLTHTNDFTAHVWDNGSDKETQAVFNEFKYCTNIKLYRSEDNQGFIVPNNELAKISTSPFLILLNSDTEVFSGWSEALIGYLQQNESVKLVGTMGGLLDEFGKGYACDYGDDIDYVMGWCCALSRETYSQYGLFDDGLTVGYFEDADLSLRLTAKGHEIYALYAQFVSHFGSKTSQAVREGMGLDGHFLRNCRKFQQRWADYLVSRRKSVVRNEFATTVLEPS